MNEEEIKEYIKSVFNKNSIELSDNEIEDLYLYMKTLKEWNKKINLTAIKDDKEIVIKHFLDSIIIKKEIIGENIIDIGSGAGFPRITYKDNQS